MSKDYSINLIKTCIGAVAGIAYGFAGIYSSTHQWVGISKIIRLFLWPGEITYRLLGSILGDSLELIIYTALWICIGAIIAVYLRVIKNLIVSARTSLASLFRKFPYKRELLIIAIGMFYGIAGPILFLLAGWLNPIFKTILALFSIPAILTVALAEAIYEHPGSGYIIKNSHLVSNAIIWGILSLVACKIISRIKAWRKGPNIENAAPPPDVPPKPRKAILRTAIKVILIIAVVFVGGMFCSYLFFGTWTDNNKIDDDTALMLLVSSYYSNTSYYHEKEFPDYYEKKVPLKFKAIVETLEAGKKPEFPFLIGADCVSSDRETGAIDILFIRCAKKPYGIEVWEKQTGGSENVKTFTIRKYPIFAPPNIKAFKTNTPDSLYSIFSVEILPSLGSYSFFVSLDETDESQVKYEQKIWDEWVESSMKDESCDTTPPVSIRCPSPEVQIWVRLYDKDGNTGDWVPMLYSKVCLGVRKSIN